LILDFGDFQNANGDFANFNQSDSNEDFADFSSFQFSSGPPSKANDGFEEISSSKSNNDLLDSLLGNSSVTPILSANVSQTPSFDSDLNQLNFQQPQVFNAIPMQNTVPMQNSVYPIPLIQGQSTVQSQQQIDISSNHSMNVNFQQTSTSMGIPQQQVFGMMQPTNFTPQFNIPQSHSTQIISGNMQAPILGNSSNTMISPSFPIQNFPPTDSSNCMFPNVINQSLPPNNANMFSKNNTWANTNLNISLDNLSPASQFKRSSAPSINQLQQGLSINTASYQTNSLANSIGSISLSQNSSTNKSTIF